MSSNRTPSGLSGLFGVSEYRPEIRTGDMMTAKAIDQAAPRMSSDWLHGPAAYWLRCDVRLAFRDRNAPEVGSQFALSRERGCSRCPVRDRFTRELNS